MHGPLEGVFVVDFTEYIAGPYGTMMLADMGARVLKVEPAGGDHWRRHQPLAPNESRFFLGVNRGKESIALRHETAEGQEIIRKLVGQADVVVVNYRPGVAEQFGVDYESLVKIRPNLIYASISAFGDQGPFAGRPGYDLLVQAMAGIMDFERKVDRGVPLGIGSMAPADLTTGMFVAYAIAAALYRRTVTGEGQKIDTNLFASAIAIQYRPTLSVEREDAAPRQETLGVLRAAKEAGATYEDILELRKGFGLQRAAALYYRVYQASDGMVAVACLNNRQRRSLRDALGMDDPAVDGDVFAAQAAVSFDEHEARLEQFETVFRGKTVAGWLETLEAADVPAVPFVLTEELQDNEQVLANDLIYRLEHPLLGEIRQPRPPIWMNNADVGRARIAPLLSAEAVTVLRDLGYSDKRVAELASDEIVVVRDD